MGERGKKSEGGTDHQQQRRKKRARYLALFCFVFLRIHRSRPCISMSLGIHVERGNMREE